MAAKHSAGLLVYRGTGEIEVLLGHMGGPFWARKDAAAWSLPKGEVEPGEDPAAAARREFTEELGFPAPVGEYHALGDVRASGKTITIWAVRADLDPADAVFGTFEMEWPPRSGVMRQFPELDRVGWFSLGEAWEKLVKGQRVFLERVGELVG